MSKSKRIDRINVGDIVSFGPPMSLAKKLKDFDPERVLYGTVVEVRYFHQEWVRDDNDNVVPKIANVDILWANGKLQSLASEYIPFMTIVSEAKA